MEVVVLIYWRHTSLGIGEVALVLRWKRHCGCVDDATVRTVGGDGLLRGRRWYEMPPPTSDRVPSGLASAMHDDYYGCAKSSPLTVGATHGDSCGGAKSCLLSVGAMEATSHACYCWIKNGATVTEGKVVWDVFVFRYLFQRYPAIEASVAG